MNNIRTTKYLSPTTLKGTNGITFEGHDLGPF
jgi:hypothetical protein